MKAYKNPPQLRNKLFLICLLLSSQGKGQSSFFSSPKKEFNLNECYTNSFNSPLKYKRPSIFTDEVRLSVGLSMGQETFIGIPKGGAYYEILLTKKQPYPSYGFHRFSFYTGAEGSIFVFFAGVFTISATAGFSLGPLTIDNSISQSVICSPEGYNSYYSTYNPKIGIQIGPVWLKGGPSFMLPKTKEPVWGSLFKTNGQPCNFELLYIVPM